MLYGKEMEEQELPEENRLGEEDSEEEKLQEIQEESLDNQGINVNKEEH